MESMMCKIKESDVSRTMHVMNFDLNMDGNIEGDGGLHPGSFEGSDMAQPSYENDDEEDTQTFAHVRFSI